MRMEDGFDVFLPVVDTLTTFDTRNCTEHKADNLLSSLRGFSVNSKSILIPRHFFSPFDSFFMTLQMFIVIVS